MPRRTLGPFPELAGLPSLDIAGAFADGADSGLMDAIADRMQLLHDVLEAQGCNCNGSVAGQQRDEYWGADISELVCRSAPHDVTRRGLDGRVASAIVSIRLETLQIEVDANNEVCCWSYDEPENALIPARQTPRP